MMDGILNLLNFNRANIYRALIFIFPQLLTKADEIFKDKKTRDYVKVVFSFYKKTLENTFIFLRFEEKGKQCDIF